MQTFCKKNSFSVSWDQANILQDENKSSTNDKKKIYFTTFTLIQTMTL